MPLLTPHFTSSQFAGYVVTKPKIIPICIMNQNTTESGAAGSGKQRAAEQRQAEFVDQRRAENVTDDAARATVGR